MAADCNRNRTKIIVTNNSDVCLRTSSTVFTEVMCFTLCVDSSTDTSLDSNLHLKAITDPVTLKFWKNVIDWTITYQEDNKICCFHIT
jgi:hypothetical protein